MGGRREVSILSHRPMTSSDLKQERLCFRESVSAFLQLVVAGSFEDKTLTSDIGQQKWQQMMQRWVEASTNIKVLTVTWVPP